MPPTNRLLLVLFLALPLSAQFLYNKDRDKKAQEAEAAAKQINNASIFTKELANAAALAKLQVDGQLSLSRVALLNQLNTFDAWKDVKSFLADARSRLQLGASLSDAEIKQRVAAIKTRQAEIKQLAASLTAAAPPESRLAAILEGLDAGDSVLEFASGALPSGPNNNLAQTFDQLQATLSVVESLLKSWKVRQDAIAKSQASLAKLTVSPLVTEAELLKLEAAYLNQLGIIAAQESQARREVLLLLDRAENALRLARVQDTDAIAPSLKAPDPETGFQRVNALLLAAAVAVRLDLADKFPRLRSSQETLFHALRQDAATARTHEQLLLNASQRLALYYSGGLKPAQLAQLLYNLSGLVSLPIIAAK